LHGEYHGRLEGNGNLKNSHEFVRKYMTKEEKTG
jgi:hypothetical protein